MKEYADLKKKNKNENKVDNNYYNLFYISFGALALLILSAQLYYLIMIPIFILLYVKAENVFKMLKKFMKD